MTSKTIVGFKHVWIALSACAALTGCVAGDGSAEGTSDGSQEGATADSALVASTCDQFGTIDTMGKTFVVQNNRWGASTKQCVSANGTSFTVTASAANLPTNGAPGGYPSIFKGCHWGNCTTGASAMMKQVSAIHSMTSNWSVSLPNSGVYDVAYDIWYNRERTANSPTQNDGTEIMVWINHRGAIQPVGSKVATASINGATWDVWHGKLSGTGKTWDVVSYVRQGGVSSVNFDLVNFAKDAKTRSFLGSTYFLTSVQAGFEIWQQAAGLKTNAFGVTVL